jgi:hypothetical protein
MANQSAANILVAIKRETTPGTAAGATNGYQMRITDSPGLTLDRAVIQSQEKRSDAWKQRGRLGGKSVNGSFNAEATVGGATDLLLEAIMRSTWATAVSISFASVTSITTGTNTVVINAGDLVAQGFRVGDIFRLSNHSTAANNDKNLRVIAVSSLTLTVPLGSLTADAVADATGTLTILKKLKSATSPTNYAHSIEQYDADIDLSELFLGCYCVGVRVSFRPGAPVTMQYTFLGMDRTALATGTSPYFSSPTLTTGLSLIADDSAILKDGVAVAKFTGFDLNFSIVARGENVIGSFVPAQIFLNDAMIDGQLMGLRSDFANLTLYDAETDFSIAIKLEENTSDPKECLAFYLPRVNITGLSAPVGGGDGAKIETLQLQVSNKVAATGHDGTPITIHSSAA